MSYSIFIWHQFIFAFYIYILGSKNSFFDYLIIFSLICTVSFFSYHFFEKKIDNYRYKINSFLKINFYSALGLICISLYFYINAGVVRDVPELDIYKGNVSRGMHAKYCDRVYNMNKSFDDNNSKIKVLAVGDSFVRDWVNILLESNYKDSLQVSYIYTGNFDTLNIVQKLNIKKADIIFVRASSFDIYKQLKSISKADIYGVGTKSFGDSNGRIYNKRFSPNYYNERAEMIDVVKKEYNIEKKYWNKKYYIDFVSIIIDDKNTVPVFTDDKKFISQDCRHLTKNGAKYYARLFDLKKYFN